MRRTMLIGCAVLLAIAVEGQAQVQLALASSKAHYLHGEPILLRTLIKNAGRDTQFGLAALTWGGDSPGHFGFSFHVARGRGEYLNFLGHMPYPVTCPPWSTAPWYRDRQHIPRARLVPGKCFERVDMLLLGETDAFRLKAVLKTPEGDRFESNEVAFDIVPLEGNDSITTVLDPKHAYALGRAICRVHFEGHYGDRRIGEETTLEAVTEAVAAECPDSVFTEYLLYAAARYDVEPLTRGGAPGESDFEESVGRFINKYPDSWLVSDLLPSLFWIKSPYKEGDFGKWTPLAETYLWAEPEYASFIHVREGIQTPQEQSVSPPVSPPTEAPSGPPEDYEDGDLY